MTRWQARILQLFVLARSKRQEVYRKALLVKEITSSFQAKVYRQRFQYYLSISFKMDCWIFDNSDLDHCNFDSGFDPDFGQTVEVNFKVLQMIIYLVSFY